MAGDNTRPQFGQCPASFELCGYDVVGPPPQDVCLRGAFCEAPNADRTADPLGSLLYPDLGETTPYTVDGPATGTQSGVNGGRV